MLEVPPRLLPLAPMLDGVGDVVTWGAGAPANPPVWDVQVEVTELPYIFRSTEADLPILTSYLRVPDDIVRRAAEAMGSSGKPRVGLVWAAGEWNRERSIPAVLMGSLVLNECAEFWSLQGTEASGDAAALIESGRMRDAAVCGDGLPALAAVIANLDLVIRWILWRCTWLERMGKPAWVLLQDTADWRWMTDRDDSPVVPGGQIVPTS